jgi:hypothetical protein
MPMIEKKSEKAKGRYRGDLYERNRGREEKAKNTNRHRK